MRGPVIGPLLADQSDQQLLARIRAGDTHAFECLYDRYAATMYAFALQTLQRRDEAETVVIETFWRIWDQKTPREPLQTDTAPWIYSIAYQVGMDVKSRRLSLDDACPPNLCSNNAAK